MTVYVIVAVPPEIPVTTPVPVPTVASAVLLLVHVPPVVGSESVVFMLVQTVDEPEMFDTTGGSGVTVTVIVPQSPGFTRQVPSPLA